MTAPSVPSFEERLAALRADWQAQLPQRLDDLRRRLQACRADPQGPEPLQDLHRSVHTLAGSAGTFGRPEMSRQARAIELQLERLLEQPARSGADLEPVAAELDALLAQAGG